MAAVFRKIDPIIVAKLAISQLEPEYTVNTPFADHLGEKDIHFREV